MGVAALADNQNVVGMAAGMCYMEQYMMVDASHWSAVDSTDERP